MLLTVYLLFIGLHVSKGCSVENRQQQLSITALVGESVLLPCYCTDLQTKPMRLIWRKYNRNTDTWEEIPRESGQYQNRVQLVNDHSPGNLSLLISHLTKEDGGDYICDTLGMEYIYIRLIIKACFLAHNGTSLNITAYTGESVLLPCFCSDLHTKPESFTWRSREEISSGSGQYRNRVQLVNDHSPGNLSLLISHLTEEDGGEYRCDGKKRGYRDIRLTVKACTLADSQTPLNITAYAGEPVLLPCYCTDLHSKPESFSWQKVNSTFKHMSWKSDRYGNRVQLVNDHSPGNLSLLISHLTEEDGGEYRCDAKKRGYRDIRLSVKACSLESSGIPLNISAHTGGSVQLSCSCTDPHSKPMSFSWRKLNTTRNTWEEISRESDQYRNRVQLVNDHSPGNLSLLISHLTEEDGGEYQCYIERSTHSPEHIVFILSVTDPPQSLPFVPFALVTVIFLHIIVAVVYHTKTTKDPATAVRYSTADGDGVASLG